MKTYWYFTYVYSKIFPSDEVRMDHHVIESDDKFFPVDEALSKAKVLSKASPYIVNQTEISKSRYDLLEKNIR